MKINSVGKAQSLLLDAVLKAEKELTKATGKDEAVIALASERDNKKFIPRRMN